MVADKPSGRDVQGLVGVSILVTYEARNDTDPSEDNNFVSVDASRVRYCKYRIRNSHAEVRLCFSPKV